MDLLRDEAQRHSKGMHTCVVQSSPLPRFDKVSFFSAGLPCDSLDIYRRSIPRCDESSESLTSLSHLGLCLRGRKLKRLTSCHGNVLEGNATVLEKRAWHGIISTNIVFVCPNLHMLRSPLRFRFHAESGWSDDHCLQNDNEMITA